MLSVWIVRVHAIDSRLALFTTNLICLQVLHVIILTLMSRHDVFSQVSAVGCA